MDTRAFIAFSSVFSFYYLIAKSAKKKKKTIYNKCTRKP